MTYSSLFVGACVAAVALRGAQAQRLGELVDVVTPQVGSLGPITGALRGVPMPENYRVSVLRGGGGVGG